MSLRAAAERVNINAAWTVIGAAVTKNARTRVRLVQAVNAGTAQNVLINQAVRDITENVILLIRDVLAIMAAGGTAVRHSKIKNRKVQVLSKVGTAQAGLPGSPSVSPVQRALMAAAAVLLMPTAFV